MADAPAVQQLAGAPDAAHETALLPRLSPEGAAAAWIATHAARYASGSSVNFAITLRETGQLIGAIGLKIERAQRCAELGYWIGAPYWNRGYCTEAAHAVIEQGFVTWNLLRIWAQHQAHNPASGRVLQKIGMQSDDELVPQSAKRNEPQGVYRYGIVRAGYSPLP